MQPPTPLADPAGLGKAKRKSGVGGVGDRVPERGSCPGPVEVRQADRRRTGRDGVQDGRRWDTAVPPERPPEKGRIQANRMDAGVFLMAEFLGARSMIYVKDENGLYTDDPK